jgi:hypothetical protein
MVSFLSGVTEKLVDRLGKRAVFGDTNETASGGLGGLAISVVVTDECVAAEVQREVFLGLKQQARRGFSAIASFVPPVWAMVDRGNVPTCGANVGAHAVVYGVQRRCR